MSIEIKSSVIDVLMGKCPYGTPEYTLLSSLKRMYTSSPNFFIIKLGLKKSKQELAIFLDDPELLDDKLSEEDVMKAIYMQSNKILNQYSDFRPEHFGRSIQCLNLDIALKTKNVSEK